MVFGKKKSEEKKAPKRETLAERRESVLAQGRKFKYPLQFAKHNVVMITIVVAVLLVAALTVAGWLALYKFGSTSDVMYRVTQVLPVSVAKIDGESTRFSDYLMFYKSSLSSVEQQVESQNTGVDVELMKYEYSRSALTQAEDYAYALKLARELGVEVTDEQIAETFASHRVVGGVERSEESFLKILQDNFGMTKSEYQRMIYLSLTRMEVEKIIDTEASALAEQVETMLAANGGDFAKVAEAYSGRVIFDGTDGLVDLTNVDGGRAAKAATLEKGQVSEKFMSSNGDGYYFVKVLDKSDTQVSYQSIKIEFTEFDTRLAELRESGAVEEFITLKEVTAETAEE